MSRRIVRYKNPRSVGLGGILRIDAYEDGSALVWRRDGMESPPYADVVKWKDIVSVRDWPREDTETDCFGCVECGTIMTDDDCGPDMHVRPCSKSLPPTQESP